MLNTIREHADSWLIKSILWLIVLAFIGTIFYSWGMGGASGSGGGAVATVQGARISQVEYERTFNNLMNFYREQFGNQFSEGIIEKLDLKTQALDVLVQKKLLLIKADELNIKVSDVEVINHINNLSAFQKDKVFNNTAYQNFLKYKRLTPSEFEESQRESLLLEKIENLIKSNVKISPNDVNEAFRKENEKVKLDYVVFPDDHFKSTEKVTQEEVRSFYEKNKIRFEVSEKIKVEYVKVIPKDYESSIDIRDEDIAEYYKTKIADFRVQKMYKAAHILFRPEPGNDSSEESKKKADEEAKKEADGILKKIRDGEDFAELAKKHSDDTNSGEKGGSLGEFPKGMMVPEFEGALEKLKPGEISEPIKTSFGFHIIRLDEVNKERIKPLEEVREEVIKKLKEIKTRQKMRRVAKHIHRSAEKDQNLAHAAQEYKLAVKTTPFFSKDNHVLPEIGATPEFFNQVFSLEDNKVGEPVQTFEATFVSKIIAREKSYIPELSDVQKLAEEKSQEEKDRIFSIKKSEEFAQKLSDGTTDLESVTKKLGLDLKHSPFFNQSDSIPGIGNLKKVKAKAFELDIGKSGWVSERNKYYLIRVQDREKASAPDPEDLKELTIRLKLDKGNSVFQEWMENLKERSEILIDKTQL